MVVFNLVCPSRSNIEVDLSMVRGRRKSCSSRSLPPTALCLASSDFWVRSCDRRERFRLIIGVECGVVSAEAIDLTDLDSLDFVGLLKDCCRKIVRSGEDTEGAVWLAVAVGSIVGEAPNMTLGCSEQNVS